MFSRSLVAFIERSVKGKTVAAAVQSARTAKKGIRGSGASLNLSSVRFGGGVAFNPERELHTQEKEAHSNRLHRSLKSSYSRTASEDTAADFTPNSRYYEGGKVGKGIELRHLKEGETDFSASLSLHPSSGEVGAVTQIERVGREHEESETIFDAGKEEEEIGMELMTREDGKARDEWPAGHRKGSNGEDSEKREGRSIEKERVTMQIREDFMSSNAVHKDISLEKSSKNGLPPQRSFLEKAIGAGGLHPSGVTVGMENSSSLRPSINHQQGGGKKSDGGLKGHLAASARSKGNGRSHSFEEPSSYSTGSSISPSSTLASGSSPERSSLVSFSHLEDGNSFQSTEEGHLNIDGSRLTPTALNAPCIDSDNSEGEVQEVHLSSHPHSGPMSSPGVSSSSCTFSESPSVLSFHEAAGQTSDASLSSNPNGGNEAGSTNASGKSVEAYRFLLHHIDAEIAALKRRHTSVTSHRVQLEDQQALRIRELYNFMESPWLLLKTTNPPPLPATAVEVYLKEKMQVMRDSSSSNSNNSHYGPSNHFSNPKKIGESSSTPLELSREKMLVLACQKNYSSLPSAEKKIYEEAAKFNAALREEMKRRLSTGCSYFEEFCEQIQECTSSMVREGRLPHPPPGTPTNFLMRSSLDDSESASVPNRLSASGGLSYSRRGIVSRGVPALAASSGITSTSERDGGDEKFKVINTTLSSPSLSSPSGGDGNTQKSPKGSLSPSVARVMSRGVMRVHHRPVSDTSSSQSSLASLPHNSSGSINGRYTDGVTTAGGGGSCGTTSRFSSSSLVSSPKGFESEKNVTNVSTSPSRIGMMTATSSSLAARKRSNSGYNATSTTTSRTSSNSISSNDSNTSLPFARQRLRPSHSPSRIVAGGNTSAVETEAHRKSKMGSKAFVHQLARGFHPPTSKTASSSVTSHSIQVQQRQGKSAAKKLDKVRKHKKKAKPSGGKRTTTNRKLLSFKSRGSQKSTKLPRKTGSAVKVSNVSASKSSTSSKLSIRGVKASKKQSSKLKKTKAVGPLKTVAMQKDDGSRRTGSRNTGQIHSTWSVGGRATTTVASSQSGRGFSRSSRPVKAWPPLSFPSSKSTRSHGKSSSWSKMGSVVVIDKHRSPSLPLPQIGSRVPTGKNVSSKKKKSSWGEHR